MEALEGGIGSHQQSDEDDQPEMTPERQEENQNEGEILKARLSLLPVSESSLERKLIHSSTKEVDSAEEAEEEELDEGAEEGELEKKVK